MDLSFSFTAPVAEGSLSSADMAVLIAALGERQATSATAIVQVGLAPAAALPMPLAPADGAFNGVMAARLWAWKQE